MDFLNDILFGKNTQETLYLPQGSRTGGAERESGKWAQEIFTSGVPACFYENTVVQCQTLGKPANTTIAQAATLLTVCQRAALIVCLLSYLKHSFMLLNIFSWIICLSVKKIRVKTTTRCVSLDYTNKPAVILD